MKILEIATGKGPMDAAYLAALKDQYAKAIRALRCRRQSPRPPGNRRGDPVFINISKLYD
jgi:hypothetical protein